jgi:PPM family protein phosphatase
MKLDVAVLSRKGGRTRNEDACGHWTSDEACCWVVSDGAGGHGGGDIASRTVVESILRAFAATPEVAPAALRRLILEANDAVVAEQRSRPEFQDMRTTGAALLIDCRRGLALWGHLGDSRIYMFREAKVLRQTRDHSVVQSMLDAGYGDASALRGHPGRSVLFSALGSTEAIDPDVTETPLVVERGDAFLLCSDGFWDYVDEAAMEKTLRTASSSKAWLAAMESELLNRVSGDHDNYTAVAVRCSSKA